MLFGRFRRVIWALYAYCLALLERFTHDLSVSYMLYACYVRILLIFYLCCMPVSCVFYMCPMQCVFYACFIRVSCLFHTCFIRVSCLFHTCFMCVLCLFHACFICVLCVFHACFIRVSCVFHACFVGVSLTHSPVCADVVSEGCAGDGGTAAAGGQYTATAHLAHHSRAEGGGGRGAGVWIREG